MPPFPTLPLGEWEVLRLPPTLSETPLDPYLHLCVWWKFMSCLLLWKWAESSNPFMRIASRGGLLAPLGGRGQSEPAWGGREPGSAHMRGGTSSTASPGVGAGPGGHPVCSPGRGPWTVVSSTTFSYLYSIVLEMISFPIPHFKKLNVLMEKVWLWKGQIIVPWMHSENIITSRNHGSIAVMLTKKSLARLSSLICGDEIHITEHQPL